MNAISHIEIAPEKYRRARCQKCHKKIMPLEVRGAVSGRFLGYLCEKHLKEELEIIPKQLKQINKEFNRLTNMSKEEKEDQLNRLIILKKLSK